MKIQDMLFLIVLAVLLFKHKSSWFLSAGVICLIISIPLFAKWVFFTAEHLTWYAAAFFLCAVIFAYFRVK
ncbi:MAG TPA: hypothetical protein VF820_05165 [Patescibacteria group bacterium]